MVSNDDREKYFLSPHALVSEMLAKQEAYKVKTFFVVDESDFILGTISDGDFRRYFLRNGVNNPPISDVMTTDYFSVRENHNLNLKTLAFDLSKGAIPVLNEAGQVVAVFDGKQKVNVGNNNVKSFTSIAPTRITFAGGGSDVADWFKDNDGKCINAAINVYARVKFELRNDKKIKIKSRNNDEHFEFPSFEYLADTGSNLIVNCLRKFTNLPGLNIEIFCDFEPGSGLGGSSSLAVAILNGCAFISGIEMSEAELQALAYEVERVDTKILGGWQDQIAAVKGGVLFNYFSKNGITSSKLSLRNGHLDYLNQSLFLFKVGSERSSSELHRKINGSRDDKNFIDTMKKIVLVADQMEELFQNSTFSEIGVLMDKGWRLKRCIHSDISNSNIDQLYSTLIEFGAQGGRLLGAGKAGFLLIFVEHSQQFQFVQKCIQSGREFARVNIDLLGARIIG